MRPTQMDWQGTLQRLCADRRSGAATLTRKTARWFIRLAGWQPTSVLLTAADQLCQAHPAMAPLWHLSQLVRQHAETPDRLRRALKEFIADMHAHEELAITHAADRLPEGMVLTHSFSSLVFRSLVRAHRQGKRMRVICTASLPGGEGVTLAKALQREGMEVLLVADLQAFAWLRESNLLLIGADALCLDGLVHKVGTRPLAYFARAVGVPVWSVATSEKRLPLSWSEAMRGEAPPLTKQPLPQDPTLYDLTEWSLITAIITEQGTTGLTIAEENHP
jgi:translation initiation factor 2B subunit (eIF-2B alpha/beta/delta family)